MIYQKIALATNNNNKILEFQNFFSNLKLEILTPKSLGLEFEAEETGNTFAENAEIKSKELFKMTKIPSISDDSGICVDALNGEPGIYSARYGKSNFSDKERATYLLNQMKIFNNRNANYQCNLAFTTNEGTFFFEGKCFGEITFDYNENGNGFGYDPIFYYPPLKKRFSEITREEKEKVSHRGIAMQKFYNFLLSKS